MRISDWSSDVCSSDLLKNGWRDSSGWCVKKYHGQGLAVAGLEFTDTARGIAAAPAAAPAKAAATIDGAGLFSIEAHTHTKQGFQMFIAILRPRVEWEPFASLLDAARAPGDRTSVVVGRGVSDVLE